MRFRWMFKKHSKVKISNKGDYFLRLKVTFFGEYFYSFLLFFKTFFVFCVFCLFRRIPFKYGGSGRLLGPFLDVFWKADWNLKENYRRHFADVLLFCWCWKVDFLDGRKGSCFRSILLSAISLGKILIPWWSLVLLRWCTRSKQRSGYSEGTRALEQWVGNRGRGSSWSRSCCRGAAYQDRRPHGSPQALPQHTRAERQRPSWSPQQAGLKWRSHKVSLATWRPPSWCGSRQALQRRSWSWWLDRSPSPRQSRQKLHFCSCRFPVHCSQGQRDIRCTPRKCPLGTPNLRGKHQTRCRGPASEQLVEVELIPASRSLSNIEESLFSIMISLIFGRDFSLLAWVHKC